MSLAVHMIIEGLRTTVS